MMVAARHAYPARLGAQQVTAAAESANAAVKGSSGGEGGNSELLCGRNALYILMRLRQIDVTFPGVSAVLPLGDHGCSLYGLTIAARNLGMEAEAVEMAPARAESITVPFIAHLKPTPAYGAVSGHYVVVVPTSTGSVILIDGTTGQAETCQIAELRRRGWTGYALVPAGAGSGIRGQLLQCIILIVAGALTGQAMSRSRRLRYGPRGNGNPT